jgi:pentatricopeptide repeat domain-containing protein 1
VRFFYFRFVGSFLTTYRLTFRLNIQILGAMLRQGCARRNFEYVLEILNIIRDQRLRPSEQLLVNLDKFVKNCRKRIHMPEHTASFKKEYHIFLQKLENWKDVMGLKDLPVQEAVKKVREHPWEQFKQSQAVGFEAEKNQKLKHKKKMERYIRRIKVEQLAGGEAPEKGRKLIND